MCCRCGELNDRADAARKKIEEDLSQALIRSPLHSFSSVPEFIDPVRELKLALKWGKGGLTWGTGSMNSATDF
jgi:hypothetical protein